MRRLGAVCVAALAVIIIAWGGPTAGQDRTDERISALETTVAGHSREIETIRNMAPPTRIAPDGAAKTPPQSQSA